MPVHVTLLAEAKFPTQFGDFRIYGIEADVDGAKEELVAVCMGELRDGAPPLLRIHSQCLTGDVFHSLRCDCRAQLEMALRAVAEEGRGLVIYEQKEGRGIGLVNKIRAYELQDHGADTVEANEALGFEADLRDFSVHGHILRALGVHAVRLLSNNPDKIAALEAAGIRVVERVPIIVDPTETTAFYMQTKKEKLGHLL
jgi:GTP cyclohydrolase II